HLRERLVGNAARGRGKQPGEQLVQLDLLGGDLMLHEVSDRGEEQCDKRDDGEQQIEREGAREEGNIVFEGRLKRATGDAGYRPMPAALGLHATGSSSSSRLVPRFPRRRRFASVNRRSIATRAVGASSSSSSAASSSSPAFSAARSRNPRSLLDSLPRDASPGSGANRKPSTAPRPKPSRNGPNPAPRSLTRRPPDHPARLPRPDVAARAIAAAA